MRENPGNHLLSHLSNQEAKQTFPSRMLVNKKCFDSTLWWLYKILISIQQTHLLTPCGHKGHFFPAALSLRKLMVCYSFQWARPKLHVCI
jgi:hypothetical protein